MLPPGPLERRVEPRPSSPPLHRIATSSAEWAAEACDIRRGMRLAAELNRLSMDDADAIRRVFSELIGRQVDDTFSLIPPFCTSGGRRIRSCKLL